MDKIKKSVWIWGAVILVLIAAAFIWFNFEKITLYSKINSPIPKEWTTIQLSNNEVLYGHLAGMTGSFIGLKDVFILEKYAPIQSANPISTSTNFSVVDSPGPQPQARLIPSKRTELLFINRESVVYWKFVGKDDPMADYLK